MTIEELKTATVNDLIDALDENKRLKEREEKAKELLWMCRKYQFHPELTEYPFNEVEAFLEECEKCS